MEFKRALLVLNVCARLDQHLGSTLTLRDVILWECLGANAYKPKVFFAIASVHIVVSFLIMHSPSKFMFGCHREQKMFQIFFVFLCYLKSNLFKFMIKERSSFLSWNLWINTLDLYYVCLFQLIFLSIVCLLWSVR